MTFGERLRELRKAQGISQRDLAELVDIDFTYVSKIETGDNAPPSMETIHRIALALSADEQELIVLAGKVHIDVYKELIERAYTLLADISHPFRPVGRYDVEKWLEDARQLGFDRVQRENDL